MRSSYPLSVLVLIIIAGCSGGGSPSPATEEPAQTQDTAATGGIEPASNGTTPPPVEDTRPRTLSFEQAFTLTLTHAYATNASSSTNHRVNIDPNCVSFGKTQVWLVTNGTATASWTPSSALAERMVVQVRDVGLVATNHGGRSPATLRFGPFHAAPNAALGLIFVVQSAETGLVAKQSISFVLSFQYLGKTDLKAEVVPCTYQ